MADDGLKVGVELMRGDFWYSCMEQNTPSCSDGRTLEGAKTPAMPQMWVVRVHSPKTALRESIID
jgi:hypothetical protein